MLANVLHVDQSNLDPKSCQVASSSDFQVVGAATVIRAAKKEHIERGSSVQPGSVDFYCLGDAAGETRYELRLVTCVVTSAHWARSLLRTVYPIDALIHD